jgi:predicted glutamine amidotransferase
MCRFIGYLGNDILLADILVRPENSLIRQSYKARERPEPLNGDGFGLGWYTPEINGEPCVFTAITPAWSNRNLLNLVEHTKSGCFFAHVRAASPGMRVSEVNCHPFQYGRFLWMHNGTIEGFDLIKRRLRHSLPDEIYQSINGTTDSEHAFAVFLNLLDEKTEATSAAYLADGLVKTIWQLEGWAADAGIKKPSIYNFAVTDGQNMATIRYVSDTHIEPISLYVSKRGKCQSFHGGWETMTDCFAETCGIVISSERLTDQGEGWTRVAPNHVVTIDGELKVDVTVVTDF